MAITGQWKRRRIVINADAYISGATSNVPVLVKFNSTSHPDLFATGDDKDSVWFSSDASGQTTLYHEGVVFSATDAIFYVKVDLSSTADTVIYFWYGTPAITGTESKTNVWTNSVGIWHLEGNSNDTLGTNNGSDTNVSYSTSYGMGYGQGASFNGSSSKIQISTSSSSPFRQATTISYCAWVYTNIDGQSFAGTAASEGHGSGGVYCGKHASTGVGFNWTAGLYDTNYVCAGPSGNTWSFVVIQTTFLGPTKTVYINGEAKSTSSANSGSPTTSYNKTNGDCIGARYVNSWGYYTGYIDEFELYSVQKSQDWAKARYNNVQNYSTFITIDGAVNIGSSPKEIYPVWPIGGPENYEGTVTAGLGIAAAISTQSDFNRSVSSGIGIAAAATRTGTLSRSVEAGIGISASATLQGSYSKSVDAGLGIAGAISTSATFSRSVEAGLGIAGEVSTSATFSRSVEAGIGISASATLQGSYSKSVDAGLGIACAVSTQSDFTGSVSSGIGIAGSVTHTETFTRSVSCGIGISGSAYTGYTAEVSSGIGIAGSVTHVEALNRTVSSGIGIGVTSVSTTNVEYERVVSSGIGIAGSVTHAETLVRSVDAGIGIAGSVTYSGYVRSVSSGIGIAGSVTHVEVLNRTVGPSIGLCVAIKYKVDIDYNLSNRVSPVRGYIGKLWSTNASIQKELRIIDIGKYTKKEIQDLKDLGFKLNYESPISITVQPTTTAYKIKLNMVTQNITAVGTTIESYLTYYKNGKAIRLSYYKDGYGEFNNVITHNNPIIVTHDTPLIIYCTHDVSYTSKIYLEGIIV